MTTPIEETGTTSNITLIFLRPFHNLHIARAIFHFFVSSTAVLTAFFLITFRVSAELTREDHRFVNIGMVEFSVASLSSSSYKTSHLQVSY